MSTTSLDDKIQQVVSEYITPATTENVGILSISKEDFDIKDNKVSIKRKSNTAFVTRISNVTKKIIDDAVVINIYTTSSLNIDITKLIVSAELLGLVDIEVKDHYTHTYGNYEVTIRKYPNKYVLAIKQFKSAVDTLELNLVCVDSLDHHSKPYIYKTSISTDFIPSILSPTDTVYGTRVPIVIDTIPDDVSKVEFSVNIGKLSNTVVVDKTNVYRFDILNLLEDTTSSYIEYIQKSAGTIDNIKMSRTIGTDSNIIIGISTSGHMTISDRNVTTQLPCHDKFIPGTVVLDMIMDYFDAGICYILTLYSNNDIDMYSVYKLDIHSFNIELALELDNGIIPVKFNKDNVIIDSVKVLGICCISGEVLFLNNELEIVDTYRFIQDRIDDVSDSNVIANICMVDDTTICVWYRYGYELYHCTDSLALKQPMRYDLGHRWLPFGNSTSTIVHTTEGLYYSTDSGTYTSSDGVTWKECHIPIYTHKSPPVGSTIRLVSAEYIDGVYHYYGCVTDHTPYPIGIVHTTDLIMYTYIPLDISMSGQLSITTITGNDILIPGYMIMLTGCKYNATIQVRCKLNDTWTDIVTKTIDVYV